MVKNPPAKQDLVRSLGWDYPLEEEMATHSSILAWRISWTEELGGLQSMGLQRVGHNSATNTFHINCRFRIQQTQAPCPLQGLAQVCKVWPKFARSHSAFLLPTSESVFNSQGLVKDKRRKERGT